MVMMLIESKRGNLRRTGGDPVDKKAVAGICRPLLKVGIFAQFLSRRAVERYKRGPIVLITSEHGKTSVREFDGRKLSDVLAAQWQLAHDL